MQRAVPPASPPALQPVGAQPFIHIVKPGESVASLLGEYISHTSYMTGAELEAALRQANHKPSGNSLKPGEQIVIPGYEAAPMVEHSVRVPKDFEVRAIYLTGIMAGSDRGIRLIREWQSVGGNAVVFDIKDSDGWVSIAFDHALAPHRRHPYIANLPKFVRFLHSLQMHAVGRMALFRDELMARNHPALAVQSHRALLLVQAAADKPVPQPWRENGKLVWADASRREVQDYNLALAKTAIAGGVDEIQFDYVRFPAEGDQADAQFAFMSEHPGWKREDVLADFLSRAYSEIHASSVLLSLDVFGVMAWQRPVDLNHTGQNIMRMAKFCDVLSPMIYPSHFFGMDGYATPGDAPEHFISESMDRFRAITQGSGAVLRPWLQAFAWRTKTYSPQYVETQVRVSRIHGGVGYLFWNARNDYGRPFIAMTDMRDHPLPLAPVAPLVAHHPETPVHLAQLPEAKTLAQPSSDRRQTRPSAASVVTVKSALGEDAITPELPAPALDPCLLTGDCLQPAVLPAPAPHPRETVPAGPPA